MIEFIKALITYLKRERNMDTTKVSDLSKHHIITLDAPSGRIIARVQTIVDSLERCLQKTKGEQ
jgi:hypothetical protein